MAIHRTHLKSILLFLLSTFAFWLLVFMVGKLLFLGYNAAEYPWSAGDVRDVLWHGLSMDTSTAGYLLAVPWLLSLGMLCFPSRWWGRLLTGYLVFAAIAGGLIVMVDTFLYPFWKFKLSATVFTYMDTLDGAANSVTTGFMLSRSAAIVAFIAMVFAGEFTLFRRFWPRNFQRREGVPSWRAAGVSLLSMLLLGGFDFLAIRGGISTAVQNVGTAYYSQTLFLNHAAVNPAFSLLSSFKRTKRFGEQYQYFRDLQPEVTAGTYLPLDESVPFDTLLRTGRPNILLILMEGFGGQFVRELGGAENVAPNFSKMIREGVFFDRYYSNSFRTDRGTVSLLSGWISYPTVSLMRLPEKMVQLPGLARSLAREGYDTEFLYGGDITFMGTSGYLVSNGFTTLHGDKDFSISDARSSKWGVADGIAAQRVAEILHGKTDADKPWFFTFQTLSSHEPFEVPYHRLADPVQNAFAYTDSCVAALVEDLRNTPLWENLLVILVPDHGFLTTSYEDPEFFHSPLLWMGGALRRPCRISHLMNQSDLCATLLAQLGISTTDYPYSRNVMHPDCPRFVYSTFPSGIMYADSTGTTVYDIAGNRVISESPTPSPQRLFLAKRLLQQSYTTLDVLEQQP